MPATEASSTLGQALADYRRRWPAEADAVALFEQRANLRGAILPLGGDRVHTGENEGGEEESECSVYHGRQ